MTSWPHPSWCHPLFEISWQLIFDWQVTWPLAARWLVHLYHVTYIRLSDWSSPKWPPLLLKVILPDFKEIKFSVVYVQFINRLKLLGFNWIIKLPWQLRCPQTEQKSQQSLIFSSRAYALVYRTLLACLGFACSNFAKKYKRLFALYDFTNKFTPYQLTGCLRLRKIKTNE